MVSTPKTGAATRTDSENDALGVRGGVSVLVSRVDPEERRLLLLARMRLVGADILRGVTGSMGSSSGPTLGKATCDGPGSVFAVRGVGSCAFAVCGRGVARAGYMSKYDGLGDSFRAPNEAIVRTDF